LLIHPQDPQDMNEVRLGPGGARLLCTAILGVGPGLESKPFKSVKAIRCWQSKVGDDGACSFAEILRLGGAECPLQYLELFDNHIGPRGCRALGVALMVYIYVCVNKKKENAVRGMCVSIEFMCTQKRKRMATTFILCRNIFLKKTFCVCLFPSLSCGSLTEQYIQSYIHVCKIDWRKQITSELAT
jgi:hypothetical protein